MLSFSGAAAAAAAIVMVVVVAVVVVVVCQCAQGLASCHSDSGIIGMQLWVGR